VTPIDPLDAFDAAAARMVESSERSGLVMIPLGHLRANPDQPRRSFEETPLEELAASIREVGILQPILVRRVTEGHYEIVAGERRWRAAQMAGLETVPVTVRALEDNVALEASLTENLQREDLSPVDEALIFHRRIEELGYSIRRLAERLGKGKGYVEDRLRIVRMDPALQQMVSGRPDTLTHAREIEKVSDPALRVELIRDVEAGRPLAEVRRKIRQRTGGEGRRTTDDGDLTGAAARSAGGASAVQVPVEKTPGATPSSIRDAARDLRLKIIAGKLPTSRTKASSLAQELRALQTVIETALVRLDALTEQESDA
jgi:ParB/RepB/Spo0J family partition protein